MPASTLIVIVRDVIIVTIQGEMNDHTAQQIQKDILGKVSEVKTQGVIVDVSKLELVDSYMARMLSDTARMVKVMGVNMVLVGVQPAVAISMVEMGLDIRGVNYALDINSALQMLERAMSDSAERYY